MSSKRIKTLLKIMDENSLAELELEEPEFKVKLKKQPEYSPAPPLSAAAPPPQTAAESARPVEPAQEDTSNYYEIKSPMVGTFYRSPSPESDQFVSEGDSVSEDAVVCVIEAMKVMNEIQANVSGKIAEIMVDNAQPVEYGQVLFRVSPE